MSPVLLPPPDMTSSPRPAPGTVTGTCHVTPGGPCLPPRVLTPVFPHLVGVSPGDEGNTVGTAIPGGCQPITTVLCKTLYIL